MGAKASTPPAASPTEPKTPLPDKAPTTAPTTFIVTALISAPAKTPARSPPREYNVQIDTEVISHGLHVELNFQDTASSSTASLISCSDQMCPSTECPSETNHICYTKVKLGPPSRDYNVSVQIDMGSDISWVTCSSCNDCPQTSGFGQIILSEFPNTIMYLRVELYFYDTAISSTASLISCSDPMCASAKCSSETNQRSYTLCYARFEWHNQLCYARFEWHNQLAIMCLAGRFSYRCAVSAQPGDLTMMDRVIDGIFGFGRHGLSVISQLSSRGISPRVFSHCLKGESYGGGILVLDEILNLSMVYNTLVPSNTCRYLLPHFSALEGQQQ
ncbi:aspartic proteinase 36-like [Lycium barbarum]|uniref:aspartic proteinase 36-like n=1 Tax=Lycium barbarum TaxID=112863 RepID=UPI00293E63AC|nr:aspartic proteinase 36-like [Lycium barbarum]